MRVILLLTILAQFTSGNAQQEPIHWIMGQWNTETEWRNTQYPLDDVVNGDMQPAGTWVLQMSQDEGNTFYNVAKWLCISDVDYDRFAAELWLEYHYLPIGDYQLKPPVSQYTAMQYRRFNPYRQEYEDAVLLMRVIFVKLVNDGQGVTR